MSWIKMRTNLLDDPRVGAISMRCGVSVTTTLGSLFVLWAIADQHSTDGILRHMTEDWLDARVGVPGFSEALREVGWLGTPEGGSTGLLVPAFDEHNGSSAKRRAMEASRKGKSRKVSASDADTMRTSSGTRAEQSREEKKQKQAGVEVYSETACSARLVRAMTLLADSPIGVRQRGEATKLLRQIAKHQDPCSFFADLTDRAEKNGIVKKGGWMMSALRQEAEQCESH